MLWTSKQKGRTRNVPNLDDRLCSLCKRFMSDILNGAVHNASPWARGLRFRKRVAFRFSYQEDRFFSAPSQIKCTICRLFTECFGQLASERAKAMIVFNRKEDHTNVRATFRVKCGITDEYFEFQAVLGIEYSGTN